MIIVAREESQGWITKGREYEVIRETKSLYIILDDSEEECDFPKSIFDIVPETAIEPIFKVGDKVFNHHFGWLTIHILRAETCDCIDSKGIKDSFLFRELSFTEYTSQGFSQERPIPPPNIGELCLFSSDNKTWVIDKFQGISKYEKYPFKAINVNFKYCKRIKFL